VPTWIRIPDHPANATDPIITVLHKLPKFHPKGGREGSVLATLPHAKKPCTHCTRGSVEPRDSLDWCRKSTAHINMQSPNSPGRSKLLYPYQEACQWSRGSTLISALEERKWLTSRLGHFNPGKETHYPLTQGRSV